MGDGLTKEQTGWLVDTFIAEAEAVKGNRMAFPVYDYISVTVQKHYSAALCASRRACMILGTCCVIIDL